MSFTTYSGSTSIIGALGTNPAERGLTTQEFKDKFDQFATAFVAWFNATHINELAQLGVMTTQGDIVYRDASGAARLAKGTAGQILKINAGATAPEWATDTVTQNAIASGITPNPTTTSLTYVDLTDMSVTLTTTGGDILVWFNGSFSNSTGGKLIGVSLKLDSGSSVGDQMATAPAAGYLFPLGMAWRFTGVAAGSHTVKVQWLVDGGTGTASGTRRSLLVMEAKR